jgi:predicted acyltransferase
MKHKRYGSIDAFRGLAIILMVVFSFYVLFSYYRPTWVLHNQGEVLLFGDLIAPFFGFLVGISLYISYARRKESGQKWSSIAKHKTKGFVFLIILGLVLDSTAKYRFPIWGVLEALGAAGLITFLVLEYSEKVKWFVCALMLGIYSYLLTFPAFNEMLLSLPHGSPLGVISWTPITIVGAIVGADFLNKKRIDFEKKLFGVGISLIALGFLVSYIIPFNKLIVSTSYSIFAAGACVLFFLVFYELVEVRKFSLKTLREFGVSSLSVWVMQFIFVYYPMTYVFKNSGFMSPVRAITVVILMLMTFYTFIKVLDHFKIRLSL